jgi:hypothetical protein
MERVSVDCIGATNRLTDASDARSILAVGRMVESMLFQPVENGGSPDSLWLGSAIALNQALVSSADAADAISVLTGRESGPHSSVPGRFSLVRVHPLDVRSNRTSQVVKTELISAGDGIDIRSWQDSSDDETRRHRACEKAFAIHYRPRFVVVRKSEELFLPLRLPSPMAADLASALSITARENKLELFEDAGLGWPACPFRSPPTPPPPGRSRGCQTSRCRILFRFRMRQTQAAPVWLACVKNSPRQPGQGAWIPLGTQPWRFASLPSPIID